MALAQDLREHGFDICHSFHPKWYNDMLRDENLDLVLLPETNYSAVLIGNTKHLWPYFCQWYQKSEKPDNPLDTYCQECLQRILSRHGVSRIYWSHSCGRNELVSMQRVAAVSGFAYHDDSSHLTVHPVYGAWHSFRAVAVFSSSSNDVPPPQRLPCLLSATEKERAAAALNYALQVSDSENLCNQLHGKIVNNEKVCMAWIAVRDCVETGKEYRFDENQLMYHYTKDVNYI